MQVRADALEGWTPIVFHCTAKGRVEIDWADLRGVRLTEPFFHETVARWRRGNPPPLISTGEDALEALEALYPRETVDPCGFVFHLGRVGSTLCARLLGALDGVSVMAEPRPLSDLFLSQAALGEDRTVRLLRLLARAWSRAGECADTQLVIKPSSWNVLRLPLFRRAFPAVPMVWLQREPLEVMASNLDQPPDWIRLARAMVEGRVNETDTLPLLIAESVLAALESVEAHRPPDLLTVDYRDLPEAVWDVVAPHFGIPCPAESIARLKDLARYDAKSQRPRPFVPRESTALETMPESARALLRERAQPLYRTLAQLGRAEGLSDNSADSVSGRGS